MEKHKDYINCLKTDTNYYIFGIIFLIIHVSSCKLEYKHNSEKENEFHIINYYDIIYNKSYIVKIQKLQPAIDSICISGNVEVCFDPCKINYIYVYIQTYDLLEYKNGCVFPDIISYYYYTDDHRNLKSIMYDVDQNNFEFKSMFAYFDSHDKRCKTSNYNINKKNNLIRLNLRIWSSDNLFYINGFFDLSSLKNEEEIIKYIEDLKKIEIIEVTN